MSGPDCSMDLTLDTNVRAPTESMVVAHVAFVVINALIEAATGVPIKSDSIVQAANAHNHRKFASAWEYMANCHKHVLTLCKTKIVQIEEKLRKPNLALYISQAKTRRPILPLPGWVEIEGKRIKTRQGKLVMQLWELHHGVDAAARDILSSLPLISVNVENVAETLKTDMQKNIMPTAKSLETSLQSLSV